MIIRLLDIVFSILGLIILLPLGLLISLAVLVDDGWPVFYVQERIGKGGKPFGFVKFRTMYRDADKRGLLTVGGKDPRVTKVGYWLRKYKLDEIPQLIHVLTGQMSFVGPRPEVKKYVDLYTAEQQKVLMVKPGITDLASVRYIDENKLLAEAEDPEKMYIREIMPAKIRLNMEYIENKSVWMYLKIIFLTLASLVNKIIK